MRCLNIWDNKIFWGAKSGPLTHAWAVNPFQKYIQDQEYRRWYSTQIYLEFISCINGSFFGAAATKVLLTISQDDYIELKYEKMKYQNWSLVKQ